MFNKCYFHGRLTADPEITTNKAGKCAKFTIAVSRDYKPEGAKYPESDFVNCVAFKTNADVIDRYFSKGSEILVETAYSQSKYTDKNGNTRYSHSFTVTKFDFVGPKVSRQKEEVEINKDEGFVEVPEGAEGSFPFN